MKKVLFLYTETAPYFMASVERLVQDHGVEGTSKMWNHSSTSTEKTEGCMLASKVRERGG